MAARDGVSLASAGVRVVDEPVEQPARRRRRSQWQIEQSAQNRSAIVRSALELFANNGYTKTTLHAVAARVGLTRQGVLHHFGSKEGLFGEVMAESDRWAGRQSAAQGGEGLAGLRAMSSFVGNSNDLHVKLVHTLQAEAMHDGAADSVVEYSRMRLEQIRKHITAHLLEAKAAGELDATLDVSVAATMLAGTITGLQIQSLNDSGVHGESAYALLVDLLAHTAPGQA